MTIEISLISILDIVALAQSLAFGGLLIYLRKRNPAFVFIGVFLIVYSAEFFDSLMDNNNYYDDYPQLLYLPIRFYFLFTPLLYLYARSLIEPVSWAKHKWHFIPGIIEFVGLTLLCLQPAAWKLGFWKSEASDLFELSYFLLAFIHINTYLLITLRRVRRHQRQVADYYSATRGKELIWIRNMVLFILAFNFLGIVPGILLEEQQPFYAALSITWEVLNIVFILAVGLSALAQRPIYLPDTILQPGSDSDLESDVEGQSSHEQNKTDHQEFEQLRARLDQEKWFTDPQLTLANLSDLSDIPQRRLSQMINEQAGMNFNRFINGFRISFAREMLKDSSNNHLTLEAIAMKVGFNSRATFYTAFKRITGTTPSQFKKQTN